MGDSTLDPQAMLDELLTQRGEDAERYRDTAKERLARSAALGFQGAAPAPRKSIGEGIAQALMGALPAIIGSRYGYLGKAAGAQAGSSAMKSLQQRSDEERKARAAQLLMLGKFQGDLSEMDLEDARAAEKDRFQALTKQAELGSRSREAQLNRDALMERAKLRPSIPGAGQTPADPKQIEALGKLWAESQPDVPFPLGQNATMGQLSETRQQLDMARRGNEFKDIKLVQVETKARNDIDALMKNRLPSKFPDSVQTFSLLEQFLGEPNASTLALAKTMFARLYDTGALSNKDIDRYLSTTAWGSLVNLKNWALGKADPNLTDEQAKAAHTALVIALKQSDKTLGKVEGAIRDRRKTYRALDDETFNDIVNTSYGAQRDVIRGLLDTASGIGNVETGPMLSEDEFITKYLAKKNNTMEQPK